MKIRIEKMGKDYYRADCLDLPGSPPCGTGTTEVMALAALMYLLIFESTEGEHPSSWHKYITRGEDIVVNDVKWSYPIR